MMLFRYSDLIVLICITQPNLFKMRLTPCIPAVTFIWINGRIIGVRKSFATMTGKGFRRRESDLGI